MKLIRLLATLAMIVAGLAAPVPAAAADFKPGPPPDIKALDGICALFEGKFIVQERVSYLCILENDEVIQCDVVRERPRCQYNVVERLWPPPITDECLRHHGTVFEDLRNNLIACGLKEGVLTVACSFGGPPDVPTPCDVGWIPSEQPMS